MRKILKVLLTVALVLLVLIPLALLGTCSVAGGVGSLFSSGFSGGGFIGKIWGIVLGAFLIFVGIMFWKWTVVLKRKGDEYLKNGDSNDKV